MSQLRKQAQEFFRQRQQVLDYLTAPEEFALLENYFQKNDEGREMFVREMSTWLDRDNELKRAFDRALAEEVAGMETKMLALVEAEWNLTDRLGPSIQGVMSQWKAHYRPPVKMVVEKSQLPQAAGATQELTHIPSDLLGELNLPSDALIRCERVEEGFEMRLESSTPLRLLVIFYRDQQEIHRAEISEQLPREPIFLDSIRNWTELFLYRLDR